MKIIFKLFLILIIGIVISIAGYVGYVKVAYPDFTYRYKMTVEVDTPEGVKSGSSVIEVVTEHWPKWMQHLAGGHMHRSRATGEAVVVDLGERGILFTAFRGSYAERIYALIYTGKGHGAFRPGGVPEYALDKDFKGAVPDDLLPTMVYFKNIEDVKTMTLVQPDDLAAAFGEEAHLKSVTVEATNEALTKNIDEKLPNFGLGSGFSEWYQNLEFGDPRQLDKSVFIKGER